MKIRVEGGGEFFLLLHSFYKVTTKWRDQKLLFFVKWRLETIWLFMALPVIQIHYFIKIFLAWPCPSYNLGCGAAASTHTPNPIFILYYSVREQTFIYQSSHVKCHHLMLLPRQPYQPSSLPLSQLSNSCFQNPNKKVLTTSLFYKLLYTIPFFFSTCFRSIERNSLDKTLFS